MQYSIYGSYAWCKQFPTFLQETVSLVASDVRMISSEPFMGTQSSSFFVSLESCVGTAGIWKILKVNIPQMNLADKLYNSYHIYIVGLFIEISLGKAQRFLLVAFTS